MQLYSTNILKNNLLRANQLSIYFPKEKSNYTNNAIDCNTLCIYLDARNNKLKTDYLKHELQNFGFECKKLPTNLQVYFDKKQLALTLKGNIYTTQ